jgi:autotransporter-associated beta strand protein/YVTN family beta-propeller protein
MWMKLPLGIRSIRSLTRLALPLAILAGLPGGAAAQNPGPYLAVAHSSGRTARFDTVNVSTLQDGASGGNYRKVVASPDGRRFYLADLAGQRIRVFDVASLVVGANVALPHQPLDIAITPDGTSLWVAASGAQAAVVIDTTTLAVTATIPVGMSATGIAITRDGQRALVVGDTAKVTVLDVATRTVVGSIPLTAPGYEVAVHPNGHRAYVTLKSTGELSVVDLDAGAEATTIDLAYEPFGLAVSPSGFLVYVVGRPSSGTGSALIIVDAATATVIDAIPGTGLASNVAFNRDGSRVYVTGMTDGAAFSIMDGASLAILSNHSTGFLGSEGLALGPPIIRDSCCNVLITSDADLTTLGFGAFVPIYHGTLITGSVNTSRTLSLLSNGTTRTEGVIEAFAVSQTFSGGVVGEGVLVKRGLGRLTLAGDITHTGGTRVEAGVLDVTGNHTSTVTLAAASTTLTGSGTIATIQATAGKVDLLDEVLHAGQVTLASGAALNLFATAPGSYPRLHVTGTATIADAILSINLSAPAYPTPGTALTLVTNAVGQFRDKPEGWTTTLPNGQLLRLTYHGGSGSDVVLMAEGPPTLAAVGDRTIVQDSTLGPITLAVADDFTTPGALTITATSSNQALVPNASLQIGNTPGARTLTATPLFGTTGQTTITITVTDEINLQVQQTFVLTVIPTRSYYLAEGATGGFFSTDILLANPNDAAAPITMTFSKDDGTVVAQQMTLPATSRTTVRVNEIAGMEAAAFSTTVVSTSGAPLVVERTMWWDASGYGASTEKAGAEGSTTWYFADGSQGYFHTYLLLFNPNVTATVARVTYLMEDGPAIQHDYPVPAGTRVTVDAGELPELLNRSFGTRIEFGLPALAERAMYFGETPLYAGGAAAAGVTTPATSWYLAEGATGSFFDTFVLIANPNDEAANLTVTYLLDNGQPIVKPHPLAAHQRLTLNIATEDPALRNAAVSTRVESDRPVVVDRSQYWPHGHWYESHASAGQTTPGLRWGLAEGRVGGASDAQTFILIANPNAADASITATFLRADGTTLVKTFTVQPTSRFTIAVTGDATGQAPELTNESFSTIVTSTQPVIVERSLYTSTGGVIWTAGTNSTGTRLEP